jgi:hypothetical protein
MKMHKIILNRQEVKNNSIWKINSFVTESLMDLNANNKGNPYVGQDQIGQINL